VSRARLLLLVLLLAAWPARGQELVADLSQRRIDITTGFAGAEVLVFGAIDGEGDVVVVTRGPNHDLVLRRKERQLGIWVNGAEARFDSVPSFYAVASTRPLWQILPEAERQGNRLGIAALPIAMRGGGADPDAFRLAFMGIKEQRGLFTENDPPAELVAGRLFSARVQFPATVVTGTYRIETMLVRAGRVVAQRHMTLEVRRVGVGADLWRFAHQFPLAYGIFAVLAAALAGWLGSYVFRKT
jgi:uncharacterized protein (TIGR02186 family)